MRGCRQPEGHKQQRDKREAAAHAREQVPAVMKGNLYPGRVCLWGEGSKVGNRTFGSAG
jgi:hypothetical protein